MAEEIRHPDGRIEHPTVAYENTDASLTAILVLIAFSLVVAVLIHVVVSQFFVNYRDRLAGERRSAYPRGAAPSTALPPEPRLEQLDRLESNDVANVYARQKAKEAKLHRYGNTEAGFVHIPIEQAIDQLIGRLPARKAEAEQGPRHDLGLVGSGEPNSGRLFRREPR